MPFGLPHPPALPPGDVPATLKKIILRNWALASAAVLTPTVVENLSKWTILIPCDGLSATLKHPHHIGPSGPRTAWPPQQRVDSQQVTFMVLCTWVCCIMHVAITYVLRIMTTSIFCIMSMYITLWPFGPNAPARLHCPTWPNFETLQIINCNLENHWASK